MGSMCSTCFKGDVDDIVTPDIAARRKLQEEAAERRMQENERRGIKDPGKVQRQQQRTEELERREMEAARHGGGNPNLRWQAN